MNDTSFVYRLLAGALLLSLSAYLEWRKHRRLSRLREYAFLFATACLAVAYALVHDIFTFALAPEYFFVLKDVAGDTFFPHVAWLAARAGWSAGLAIGLGLLIANNPARRDQLPYATLAGHIRFPLFWSLAAAIGGGLYARYFMPDALHAWGLEHPRSVITVWGGHIGSYVGALLGLVHACLHIRGSRARGGFAACCPRDALDPSAG